MEKKIDPAMAQRVWQRVQHTQEPQKPDASALLLLLSQAQSDADDCQRLARTMGGKGGILLRLAREDRAQANALRGICKLLTGQAPQVPTQVSEPAPVDVVLQRCYSHHLHRLRAYSRYREDEDMGPAFEKLAAEERSHCKALLELLGTR